MRCLLKILLNVIADVFVVVVVVVVPLYHLLVSGRSDNKGSGTQQRFGSKRERGQGPKCHPGQKIAKDDTVHAEPTYSRQGSKLVQSVHSRCVHVRPF